MRVLFVSHSFPVPDDPLSNVGGMQRVSVELHAALRRHPEVELSERLLETSWKRTGVRMVPFMGRLLAELPRQVRREGTDVVLFSSLVTASSVLLLRGRLRAAGALTAAIPLGRDVTLPSRLYQQMVPRVLDALDVVLPISRATAQACLTRGSAPDRTHVVPCGVDLARFEGGNDREAARRALLATFAPDVPEDSLLICSVGRHQERKGFHWFVERVMPILPPRTIFLLGGEGPMTPLIQEIVRREGLESRVRLLGRLPEEGLTVLYRGADLFVMPNIPVLGDMEGFGVVMLEAGACGLPVVAADLEGIRDVVRQGTSGDLVASGDAAGFAAAILRLLDDRDRLRSFSSAAEEYTRSTFGWDAITDRYVRIFRKALAGRRGGTESGLGAGS